MRFRLAHLILAHAYPKQLERLVKRLHHPEVDIYIHLDPKANIKDFNYISNLGNVYFTPTRIHVRWGTYSLVQATLNGMQHILDSNIAYCHINLLSAQDYPLKNAEEIYKFFISHTGRSFMDMPVIGPEWQAGVYRIENYNFGDYQFPGHYVLQYMVNLAKIKKATPKGLTPFGRSQWLSITPAAALYVICDLSFNPHIKRYFRMSFAPDEFIFQTILGNSCMSNTLINDNLRYINFPNGNHHPNTLTVADANDLTSSGKLFARKFDPNVDSIIMNYLDWVAKFGINPDDYEYAHLKHIFNPDKQVLEI